MINYNLYIFLFLIIILDRTKRKVISNANRAIPTTVDIGYFKQEKHLNTNRTNVLVVYVLAVIAISILGVKMRFWNCRVVRVVPLSAPSHTTRQLER